MKVYVANIVRGFDEMVRVGVVTYSNSAWVSIPLTSAVNPMSIASSILQIVYTSGGTNTAAGINLARSLLSQQQCSGVIRSLSVLTDGQANNRAAAERAAQAAKEDGIQVYATGIGSGVSQNDLQSIASTPTSEYLQPIADFSEEAFNEKVEQLQMSACKSEYMDTYICLSIYFKFYKL